MERLRELISLRKKEGCKLDDATILSKLKWAVALGSVERSKPSEDLGDNVQMPLHSATCVPKALGQTELNMIKDQPRVLGKAKAYSRSFLAKKVNRNKSIVEAVKQQDIIKTRLDGAKSGLAAQPTEENTAVDAVLSNKETGKHCVTTRQTGFRVS